MNPSEQTFQKPVKTPLLRRLRTQHPSLFIRIQSATSAVQAIQPRWPNRVLLGFMLGIGCGVGAPALAAENLAVKLGPFQQAVRVGDLEYFAKTGDLTVDLRPYRMLMNEDVRQALNSSIPVDPRVGDKLVEDLLHSSAGERLLTTLETIIPGSDRPKLRKALTLAATRTEGLSLLGFMREYPDPQVTIDLSSLATLASQMNLPYWQSQALSSILERELTIPQTKPFSSPIDPTAAGPQWVRQQTLIFRDYQRDRTIPVDLYWSRRTQGPLVVISHGFGADRRFLGYLAYHLASYGFTVAALEHPGSNVAWLTGITSGRLHNGSWGEILPATEFIDRPQDVSFLLSELDRINRHSTILHGKFNTENVTLIGHSLGGYTALALAGAELNQDKLRQFCHDPARVGFSVADWLQCTAADLPKEIPGLRDRRIKQIIALNPVIGQLFDETSLTKIRTPTLILSGTSDAIMPAVSQQLLPFTYLHAEHKYLLTAIGGSHLSVGDPANLNQALTESLFMRERSGNETKELRQLLQGVTLAFVKQMTPDAAKYQPFLTAAYAQSFSTAGLQLRLNSKLPNNLQNWLKMAALPMEQMTSNSETRSQLALRSELTYTGVTFLLVGLPLVMFILPGNMPLSARRLLKQRRSWWQNRQADSHQADSHRSDSR